MAYSMSQLLDRIRRTLGLSVDNRFVSKLISTQYDDLMFEENGKPVHPEMDDILQLFGAMEQFSEDAAKRMEKLDMPELSADAKKEMDDVLGRIAALTKKAESVEPNTGIKRYVGNFFERLSERSKGSTRERFAAVFKSSVDVAVALGEQVRAEKDYLRDFGVLEEAMSEGTVLAANVRKRQNARMEAAVDRLTQANQRLDGMDAEHDDYALVRRDAVQAQRAFDLENKRKLFASELFAKMSSAYDFSCTLAVALAQKTMTKESLWIAMTNSLNTQQTTFSLAQANISSLESMNEATRMKSVLDEGSVGVVQQIGKMSVELQRRATLISHTGGLGVEDLKSLAGSIHQSQREIAPLRQQLIDKSVQEAQNVHQACLSFQREMRSITVGEATRSLAHEKEAMPLGLPHQEAPIDVEVAEVSSSTPALRARRMG